jgi:hypothetical protein
MTNIYYNILNAIATQLQTVYSNVSVRVTAISYSSVDFPADQTNPLVIVSPMATPFSNQGEKISQVNFDNSNNVWWDYPIQISIINPGNRLVALSGIAEYMLVREQIRNTCYQIPSNLNLGANIFDIVDFACWSVVQEPTFKETQYYTTGFTFAIRSNENRLGA